jgi:hypothetical protein
LQIVPLPSTKQPTAIFSQSHANILWGVVGTVLITSLGTAAIRELRKSPEQVEKDREEAARNEAYAKASPF